MRSAIVGVAAIALAACGNEAAEAPAEAPVAADAPTQAPKSADAERTQTKNSRLPNSRPGAVVPASVLCRGKEQAIFSCKVENGKRIAVCAAPGGPVQYRFGADTPEITLDASRWASVPYSGGGEAQIAFANGDTRYIVFSRMVRTNFEPGETNDPAISDGVVVLRGERFLGLQRCNDPNVGAVDVNALGNLLPRMDELFTYETERADRE